MSVYEIVTNKIISELEKGNVPWKKNWSSSYVNYMTKKPYRGINRLLLNLSGFKCPYFLTFLQAKEMGLSIKKGSNASIVVFYKIDKQIIENEINDEVILKNKYILRYYNVFNLEQTDYKGDDLRNFKDNENAETVIEKYTDCPVITNGDSAFYTPVFDEICVPSKNNFSKVDDYYLTLFHEVVHSTGHSKRLSRKGVAGEIKFGSEIYSEEELIAEIGSNFLCEDCGLNPDFNNSLSYIKGWLSLLKDDKRIIVFAAGQAEKACEYIKGL